MVTPWWSYLSSSEIRRRLVQRGVNPGHALFLVTHREWPRTAAEITRRLAR